MPHCAPARLLLGCVASLMLIFASAVVVARSSAACWAGETAAIVLPAAQAVQDLTVALPAPIESDAPGWQLVETDHPQAAIPAALVTAIAPDGTAGAVRGRLVAAIGPRPEAREARRFSLQRAASPASGPAFAFRELDDKSLGLWEGDRPVLVYNFGTVTSDRVPVSDSRRNRGCYVHPLYGLSGEVLSDAFPKDHYHHVGLFWAWPHIRIDDQQYDLWTSKDIQQKFVRWLCREAGPLAAVLGVENGWFVGDRQVLTERVWFTVHRAADGHQAIDVRLVLIPGGKPVTLWGAAEKSYGGLNFRCAPPVVEARTGDAAAAAKPPAKEKRATKPRPSKEKPAAKKTQAKEKTTPEEKATFITVPDGLTQSDLPETRLPWADMVRCVPGAAGPSGAALFVDPRHPDYPPTWLTRHYGILCIGWPGVQPCTLEPGRPVALDYRVWIHKTALDVDALRAAYEGYVTATKAACK